MHTCCNNRGIEIGHGFQCRIIVTRYNLDDLGNDPFLVPRINALRTIADMEVCLPLQAGFPLKDGNTNFLGRTGIDG